MATPQETIGCSAYDRLDQSLKQSYKSYGKLRQDGELSQLVKKHVPKLGETKPDDMYVPHHYYDDEMKPAEHTSDYLRGGVISTMATFEAFVGDLINEATDIAKDPKYIGRKKVKKINSTMSKRCNQNKEHRPKPKGILVHQWDTSIVCPCTCVRCTCTKITRELYPECLLTEEQKTTGMSIIDRMLKQGDFRFKYKIRNGNTTRISQIVVSANGKQSKCFICVMLRFCYGIRCVMAHGNSTQTYAKGGVFYDFVKRCKACGCEDSCPECNCFEETAKLVNLINNKYIKRLPEQEKKEAESRVRRIPKIMDIHNFRQQHSTGYLKKKEWDECEGIIRDYFQDQDKDPLPASYAYFHMLRVYYWLDENKRAMYVTYGMFERITTFIHTLSTRMYLAVAELLIDNYKLTGPVWGTAKIRGMFTSQFTKLVFFDSDSLKIQITLEKRMTGKMIRQFQNHSVATRYNHWSIILLHVFAFL